MSDHSAIQWTGATWNPVTGCTKVSPGCAHCYIERQTPMRVAGRRFVRGTLDVREHPERLIARKVEKLKPLGRPIFVCSMSDLFHEDVQDGFVSAVWDVMHVCDTRTFQVLTKRPERALELLRVFNDPPLPNVHVGVTIENARFTWRANVLREIPASVRFLSCEPLLDSLFRFKQIPGTTGGYSHAHLDLRGIDWVIAGGESGPGYRPLNLDHARELRDACLEADVPFFFKQVGGRTPKSGGELLDGREWKQMPQAVLA